MAQQEESLGQSKPVPTKGSKALHSPGKTSAAHLYTTNHVPKSNQINLTTAPKGGAINGPDPEAGDVETQG